MTFEQLLWEETRRVDFSRLPFVRAVDAGTCPPSVLQAYATELAALATGFPRLLCAILALCDDADVRRAVLSNLLEEEGITAYDDGHLVLSADGGHGPLAQALARTLGVTGPLPRTPRTTPWLDDQLRAGRWLGPLAFVTVGYEANVPAVFKPIAAGLHRHYGYSAEDLRYLTMHVAADEEHGAEGVAVIARVSRTPEQREEALDGARRGVLGWYHLHRRLAQAMSRARCA